MGRIFNAVELDGAQEELQSTRLPLIGSGGRQSSKYDPKRLFQGFDFKFTIRKRVK